MSQVKVQGNVSGTGTFTITSPNSNTDRTLTLPDNTGTVVTTSSTNAVTPSLLSTGAPSWDGSGNLQFNSGYGSVATAYGCRAWVNFNGTGTVAIRASGGVTSITDNGVGDYTVNLSFTMPDTNFIGVITTGMTYLGTSPNNGQPVSIVQSQTTTGFRTLSTQVNSSGNLTAFDVNTAFVAIFR